MGKGGSPAPFPFSATTTASDDATETPTPSLPTALTALSPSPPPGASAPVPASTQALRCLSHTSAELTDETQGQSQPSPFKPIPGSRPRGPAPAGPKAESVEELVAEMRGLTRVWPPWGPGPWCPCTSRTLLLIAGLAFANLLFLIVATLTFACTNSSFTCF